MNHQPFRDWLVSDELLSIDQIKALREHVNSCESCSQIESAWKDVEAVIRKTPQVGPAPGFTGRWELYLVEQQIHKQARAGWFSICAIAVIVISLLTISATQLWSQIQSPGPYVATLLDRLVGLASIYYLLKNIVSSNSWSGPFYTFIGMFFIVGFISFMCVLWLTAYQKININRRRV